MKKPLRGRKTSSVGNYKPEFMIFLSSCDYYKLLSIRLLVSITFRRKCHSPISYNNYEIFECMYLYKDCMGTRMLHMFYFNNFL